VQVQSSPVGRHEPVSDGFAVLPRRADTPGMELELLLLAVDRDSCAGVDLASGALVRAWSPEPFDERLRPYDVVVGTLAAEPNLVPDPAQAEAVVLATSPELIGRITGRRAERYLRDLVHPPGQTLLGFHGPAVPFWERTADFPSIALVEPEGTTVVGRRGPWLTCVFGWRGSRVELPFVDRRVARALARAGRSVTHSAKGDRLVVALAPPIDGHCHKVVAALLPRP